MKSIIFFKPGLKCYQQTDHFDANQASGLIYKMRYSAGAGYALNFRSELSIRYILEGEINVANPLQSHILVFGFSHSL